MNDFESVGAGTKEVTALLKYYGLTGDLIRHALDPIAPHSIQYSFFIPMTPSMRSSQVLKSMAESLEPFFSSLKDSDYVKGVKSSYEKSIKTLEDKAFDQAAQIAELQAQVKLLRELLKEKE